MLREVMIRMPEYDDVYVEHQAVWKALSGHLPEKTPYLYRRSGDLILVRSPHLRTGNAVALPQDGERVALSLRFNPVVTEPLPPGESDRRAPRKRITCPLEALNGISLRLSHAFDLMSVDGRFMPGVAMRKPGCAPIILRCFHFEGEAIVKDAAEAKKLLEQGLGKAKRFGFGMLEAVGVMP